MKRDTAKKTLALLFSAVLFLNFLLDGSFGQLEKLSCYLNSEKPPLSETESEFCNNIVGKTSLINLNGSAARFFRIRGYYAREYGIYVTDEPCVVSAYPRTSTDYEYEQTEDFYCFLRDNGVNLLYVNLPIKYLDDSLIENSFGVPSWSNRNLDLFLDRLRGEEIPVLDLRDAIRAEGMDSFELFYRTDHHWTVPAGLWAARHIAQGMNESCGGGIDPALYDESNYSFTHWDACWLGEQGRLLAMPYVGLDDFTEVKPLFETHFTFKDGPKAGEDGSFDDFVNEALYYEEPDYYRSDSWHYSYQPVDCINRDVPDGKVLLLGDSYSNVLMPFLSLGVHEIDWLMLRSYDSSFDLRKTILDNGYDTVLICYAQFMLGAHDNPDSANYRMFDFH